ncbi:hypothetical protein ACVW00_001194 [Marmoricola sp. URHA0025 HA25]
MAEGTHDRIPGYLGALTVFGTSVLAAVLAGRAADKELPERFTTRDLVIGAVATHKFTRILAKDAITTPIRAPFTEFEKPLGSGEVQDRVRSDHPLHSVGELLTCPFCLAPWTATAYVAGLSLAPRAARAWAAVFAVVGGSDALQHLYARLRTD